MKIKYIFMVIILTFFIGVTSVDASSINYNVRIDDALLLHETITYNVDKKDVKNDGTYDFLSSVVKDPVYFDLKEEVPYQKTLRKTNTGYTVVLKNDFASIFLSKSRIVKECFTNYKYNDTNNKFSFSASEFYCAHRADTINVTITTDLEVINCNAPTTVGNNYIWENISKDFSIKFVAEIPMIDEEPMDSVTEADDEENISAEENADTNEDNGKENNEKEKKNKTYSYTLMIVLGSCGLFVLLLTAIVLKQKSSHINKI